VTAGFVVPVFVAGTKWDLRFVFLYADSSNYVYVKCTQDNLNGEFSVWEVIGGTHYQAGTSYTFSSGGKLAAYNYTLDIWYDENEQRVLVIAPKDLAVTSGDTCILLDETISGGDYYTTGYGTLAGFATGTIDATYSPVKFLSSWDAFDAYDCDISPCQYTRYNEWPISLQIELQGFADSADPCPTCDDINAVYVVDQEQVACTLGARDCDYSLEDYDVSCGTNPISGQPYPVTIHAYFTSDADDDCENAIVKLVVTVRAQRSDSPTAGTISGEIVLSSLCGRAAGITGVQALEIDLDTLDGWEFCDYSSAKAIVTAS
jgi:hypothetical protein